MATDRQESALEEPRQITLSAAASTQLAEIMAGFGWANPKIAAERLVATFHGAYVAAAVPEGWVLNDDLTLDDLEKYFEVYEAEKSGNAWHERGRTLRAAVAAGWFTAPVDVASAGAAGVAMIGRLNPREAARLKNAIDAHYTRLTVADPNSSGPSLIT